MSFKCPQSSNPQTPPITQPTEPDRARKITSVFRELENLGGVISDKAKLEAEFSAEYARVIGNLPAPTSLGSYKKAESVMARLLGWQSMIWQAASNTKTASGEIQYLLIEKAKLAKNIINSIATYESLPKVRSMHMRLKESLKDLPEGKLNELLHDHIIIGQFPKLRNLYPSQVVHTQIAAKYQRHVQKLQELGLERDVIKQLDELAGEISGTFDKIRYAAGRFGLGIEELGNGGYFPIQALPEIQKILDKTEEGLAVGKKLLVNDSEMLNRTRKSLVPIVLEPGELASLLKLKNEYELMQAVVEPGKLTEILSKFSDDELTQLFDQGILANMPALSDELLQFYSKNLGLPVNGLGEAIVLDPVAAIKRYSSDLEKGLVNSSYYKTALDDGINSGWVVTKQEIPPGLESSFARVGNDPFLAKTLGSEVADAAEDLFMHKAVMQQLKSIIKLNTDFSSLGLLGSGLQFWMGLTASFNKGVLLGTGMLPYVKRVYLQNAVSLHAVAGFDGLAKYTKYATEYTRAFIKKDINQISDELLPKFGDGTQMSRRELFKQMGLRRLSDFSSGLGEQVRLDETRGLFELISPVSLQRMHKFNQVYYSRFGSPITGNKLGSYLDIAKEVGASSYKKAYEYLARTNQHLDVSARWAAIDILAKNPSKAGLNKWDNLEQLLRYSDEYFGINENVGELGQFARYLVPFASFSMVAPGSTIRHALRHPGKYLRTMQLYSVALHNQNRSLSEDEQAEWEKDGYVLYIGENEEGKKWGISPDSVDYMLSSTLWVKEMAEKVGRGVLNLEVGTKKEILEDKLNPSADISKFIQESLDRFIFGDTIKAGLGINPDTNRPYPQVDTGDSLVGVGLPSQLRDIVASTFPLIKALDRGLPPSVVGQSERRDSKGNVIQQASPGLFGGTPQSSPLRDKPSPSSFSIAWIANAVGGLSLSDIDPEANTIRNYKDLAVLSSDVRNQVSEINEKLIEQPTNQSLLESRQNWLKLQGLIEYQMILIRILQRERGYSDAEAVRELRSTKRSWLNHKDEALTEYLRQQTE